MPVDATLSRVRARMSLVLLGSAMIVTGCGPDTADRERMAAEMQEAAPDLIVGYHVGRWSLIDDAYLDLYLSREPSTQGVEHLACNVVGSHPSRAWGHRTPREPLA